METESRVSMAGQESIFQSILLKLYLTGPEEQPVKPQQNNLKNVYLENMQQNSHVTYTQYWAQYMRWQNDQMTSSNSPTSTMHGTGWQLPPAVNVQNPRQAQESIILPIAWPGVEAQESKHLPHMNNHTWANLTYLTVQARDTFSNCTWHSWFLVQDQHYDVF